MSWYSKERYTRFDAQPIDGLHFLIGDLQPATEQTPGSKTPQIMFPSGLACAVWEASAAPDDVFIHLFDDVDVPLYGTRDYAYERVQDALSQSERLMYFVHTVGEDSLVVWGNQPSERLYLTYDNETTCLTDVIPLSDNVNTPAG